MTLEGRVALVTGGGRGIGRAIAMALAEDGADVAINYRRDKESADETVAAVEAVGRKAIAVPGSISELDDVREVAATTLETFGYVDILINNAGVASRGRTVADTDPEEVERLVRTHAIGPHWLTGMILPSMRQQPRGDIVFISSAATRHLAPNSAPYNMGKVAMEALAYTLAKEERSRGIHTNIVAPGLVKTEMGARLMKAFGQNIEEMDAGSFYGRVCRPEDVANVVRWVVSDGASYVNGERIYVDGGDR